MSAHGSYQLSNGHTLTVVEKPNTPPGAGRYQVEERNAIGTFLHVAYASGRLVDAEGWVARAMKRGYGLRPVLGGRSTDQLSSGDIVWAHGMRLLVDREIREYMSGGRIVYNTKALVLNRDDVPETVVPYSWTKRTGEECGSPVDHRWTIQGNSLARWYVEEPPTASERIRASRELKAGR